MTAKLLLANLNNSIVWMVLAHPSIFISSSSHTNPLETILSASITVGITIPFMFHNFLVLCLGPSTCLSFHSF